MRTMLNQIGRRARRAAGLLAVAALVPAAACSVDEIVEVTDPDIINPNNVNSAAGAAALSGHDHRRLGKVA